MEQSGGTAVVPCVLSGSPEVGTSAMAAVGAIASETMTSKAVTSNMVPLGVVAPVEPVTSVAPVTSAEDPEPGLLADFDRTRAQVARLVSALDRQTGRTLSDNALDLEDSVQDVYLRVIEGHASGVLVANPEAYVSGICRGVMRQVGPMRIGSADRKALLKLTAWRRGFIAAQLREPTAAESAAAAEKIRAEWPDPRHRPSKDFHLWVHGAMDAPRSLSSLIDAGETSGTRDALPPSLCEHFDDTRERYGQLDGVPSEDIRWAEIAEACATPGGFPSATRRQAKLLLFPACAQFTEAPVPTPGLLPRNAVTEIRREVNAVGGVEAVIDTFDTTDETDAVDALFGPWSDQALSFEDRAAIVRVLRRRGATPRDMWESALRFASRDQFVRICDLVDAWYRSPQPALDFEAS